MKFHFFFFNDTATTEIYTLSLHDALPISRLVDLSRRVADKETLTTHKPMPTAYKFIPARIADLLDYLRSEEHTSELQSQSNLVCRLLLEKKKTKNKIKQKKDEESLREHSY